MDDIRIILNSFINSESTESADGKIAMTIFENINSLGDYTSTDLAKLCNVSNSAITRFCKRIGLEGFYELHYLIKKYQRRPEQKFHIENEDSKSLSLTRYIDLQMEQILHLRDNLEIDKLFQLAHLLFSYKNIVLMGILQSSTSALQLQATLLQNDIVSRVLVSPVKQRSFFDNLKEDSLVIVFSVSGNLLQRVLGEGMVPKTPRSKYVLITQNENLKSPRHYDLVINTRTTLDYSSDHVPFSVICSLIALACYQISDQYNK